MSIILTKFSCPGPCITDINLVKKILFFHRVLSIRNPYVQF